MNSGILNLFMFGTLLLDQIQLDWIFDLDVHPPTRVELLARLVFQ